MQFPEMLEETTPPRRILLGEQAYLLGGFALPYISQLIPEIEQVCRLSPFRNMVTPGGYAMSVGLTNCGALGWTTHRRGYQYTTQDPDSGNAWPPMPLVFTRLATEAAREAGFNAFIPDACLINQYLPGSKLSLHQDKNERDFRFPIVSVSLGMPATFLFGGNARSDPTQRVFLQHGDVMVWGGVDRLRYHGVMPLKDNPHPLLGSRRINFTFRRTG